MLKQKNGLAELFTDQNEPSLRKIKIQSGVEVHLADTPR